MYERFYTLKYSKTYSSLFLFFIFRHFFKKQLLFKDIIKYSALATTVAKINMYHNSFEFKAVRDFEV